MMLPHRLHGHFFDLIRSGLWSGNTTMIYDNISSDDWIAIYRESVAQTVSGLVFEGIAKCPYDSLPGNELLAKWSARTVRIANNNDKANATISAIVASLNSVGITPVLLKGQATALMYPDSSLRECGDIDFDFLDDKDFTTARSIVGKGYMLRSKNDGSFVCNRNGVIVELHGKMFDMVNPVQKRYLSSAISDFGFRHIDWADDPSVTILKPAPILNMLMQNLHILRHALSFGIGLRQLCDYAVCYRNLTDYEISELTMMLDKMWLRKWNRMLMSFLNTYLNGNSRLSAPNALYKIVMETGNFGFAAESRSWRRIASNNARLFPTVPCQSLTALLCLLTR